MVSKQQRKVGFKSNLNRWEKKAFLAAVSTVAEEGKSVKILTALLGKESKQVQLFFSFAESL